MKWPPTLLILLFSACEEVIQLEPTAAPPRLIIDALLRAEDSGEIQSWKVQVSLTDGFFGEIPVTRLKQISMGGRFFLELEEGTGVYELPTTGTPIDTSEGDILIQVSHEDQFYLAFSEYFLSTDFSVQYLGLFDQAHTVNVSFEDDPEERNFYLFDFGQGEYYMTDDEFYNGETHSFRYTYLRQLETGDQVDVSLLGSDAALNNYMTQLVDQARKEFGPFETPTSTVRGNFINATEIDNINSFDNVNSPNNYALGYFAVMEEVKQTFVVE